MIKVMRIVWVGMDASDCGAGAPGEDYQLLYNVTYDGDDWYIVERMIRDIAREFTTEDENGETPYEVLCGGDRLEADDYIKQRMAELMPDVIIDLCEPEGFTVEIN